MLHCWWSPVSCKQLNFPWHDQSHNELLQVDDWTALSSFLASAWIQRSSQCCRESTVSCSITPCNREQIAGRSKFRSAEIKCVSSMQFVFVQEAITPSVPWYDGKIYSRTTTTEAPTIPVQGKQDGFSTNRSSHNLSRN